MSLKETKKSIFSASFDDFSPPACPEVDYAESPYSGEGDYKHKSRHGKQVSFPSFARAIERGDVKFIDRTLAMSPSQADFRDMMTGTSILHVASRGQTTMLEKLLKHPHVKVLVNATDNKGATPLIVAVWHENLGAVRLLLKSGAKTKNHLHETGQTALHIAATHKDESILKEILHYNNSQYFLDWFDKKGDTALLMSGKFDSKCSETLLKAGANHLVRNRTTERNILHLAVLYQRRELVEFLLTAYPENAFAVSLDANGDSPLKLALELKDTETAMIILKSTARKKSVAGFPEALIMAIHIGKEKLFDQILQLSSVYQVSSYCNDAGETALAVAASNGHVEIVDKLLQRGVKTTLQDNRCAKSIMDSLMSTLNSAHITKLLLDAQYNELEDVADKDIKALYEIILRRPSLGNLIVFHQSAMFDHIDNSFDSPLHMAAKMGNFGALLFLLMSTTCSKLDWASISKPLPTYIDLLRLYLKHEIYASDIYVLTGTVLDNPRTKLCPSQGHLFKSSKDGRNIFHACAIGGNLNAIIFIYEYCSYFRPTECQKMDVPDVSGSTPLLLAVLNKSEDVAGYLIQKGANLIKPNKAGERPIRAITKHIPDHKSLLKDAMTQCIVAERLIHMSFSVQLYLLCPKNAKYVSDVGFEICKLDYFKYQDILCHPLLEYFVWYLWNQVGHMMVMRFYVGAASTIVFSLFVSLKYCEISSPQLNFLSIVTWWLSLWLAKMCFLFHLPIFYLRARFVRRLMLVSTVVIPLLEIIYLTQFNFDDRTSLEVGGTAILASWLNLLFHGVATPNDGIQIMTFWMVFQEMCVVIPTFFIVTLAFTLYFFTLFNGYYIFNNPIHSFIFTAYQIPQGSIDTVPSLYEERDNDVHTVSNASATDFSAFNSTVGNPLLIGAELRTMLIEGMTVLVYLLVATALTNMLTALAIRAGEEHLIAKRAKTIARKMSRIHEWEKFVNSGFYKFLFRCKALWVVGVPPNVKEVFQVPRVIRPAKTTAGYDVYRMKKFLTENEDLVSNKETPFLLNLLKNEKTNNET